MSRKFIYLVTSVVLISLVAALFGCTAPAPTAPASKPAPAPTPAPAPSAADFYKDKTVKIVIPSDPGGSIDTLTRLATNYLPNVTGAKWGVVNEPAGGGLVYNNGFVNVKPDGLTILANSMGKLWPGWLMGDKDVKYDITKDFEYFIALKGGAIALGMGVKTPYTSVDALKQGKGLKFASRQPTSLLNLGTLLIIEALSLDAKVIAGLNGTPEILLSIAQGETDGSVMSGEGLVVTEKQGQLKGLIQVGMERDKNFPDWACLNEVTKLSDLHKRLLGAIFPDGKAYMVPAGTPPERIKFLADSFGAVYADKKFQQEVEKISGTWLGTQSGKEVTDMAKALSVAKGDFPVYLELIKKYVK
jgi:tripartite-type tricarboxylate transporter receptor subunit TctC